MRIRDTLPRNTPPKIAEHIIEMVSIDFLANGLIFLNKIDTHHTKNRGKKGYFINTYSSRV